MLKKYLSIIATIAFAALTPNALFAADNASTGVTTESEAHVVYHVNNITSAWEALANIRNHLVASPKTKITLLANGQGIYMLIANEHDKNGLHYSADISRLQSKGVRFLACQNSLTSRKINSSELLEGIDIVPAGVVELARLQLAEGYAYIKP